MSKNAAAGERARTTRDVSRFAVAVRRLDPRVLPLLGLVDAALALVEVAVVVSKAACAADDERSGLERIGAVLEERLSDFDPEKLTTYIERFQEQESAVRDLIEKVANGGFRLFALRLLGEAEYRRLEAALKEDAAFVVLALRRGVRALLPLSLAFEAALGTLNEKERARLLGQIPDVTHFLDILITVDKELGSRAFDRLPMSLTDLGDEDLKEVDPDGRDALVAQLQATLAEDSLGRLASHNAYLTRKLRGARQALDLSDDGVSQAANSLVELIDRLLREAHSKDEVLSWSRREYPGDPRMSFRDGEQDRPTKRAEVMCFVFGGGSTTAWTQDSKPSALHEVLALAILNLRERLQKMKHAEGEGDLEVVVGLLDVMEGVLALVLRLASITNSSSAAHPVAEGKAG